MCFDVKRFLRSLVVLKSTDPCGNLFQYGFTWDEKKYFLVDIRLYCTLNQLLCPLILDSSFVMLSTLWTQGVCLYRAHYYQYIAEYSYKRTWTYIANSAPFFAATTLVFFLSLTKIWWKVIWTSRNHVAFQSTFVENFCCTAGIIWLRKNKKLIYSQINRIDSSWKISIMLQTHVKLFPIILPDLFLPDSLQSELKYKMSVMPTAILILT